MKTKIIFSESFTQFLSKSRWNNKVSQYIYCANRYVNSYDYAIGNLMLTDNEINYITFRNDGTISYLPAGKKHQVNEDGTWKREGRQYGKAAKVIKKIINKKSLKFFKDADFESFSNTYKAEYCNEGYKLNLLSNKKIKDVYSMQRCEGEGTLQSSCMNGDIDYLDIYHYCDKLQILTLTNKDGLLAGRSLVWKVNDEITLLDRIYVTLDWQYEYFLEYAKANNFWHKKYFKTYDNKDIFINTSGEQIDRYFKIYTNTDFDQFPYIDTFSFGEDGYLTNEDNCQYSYNNTDGTREGDEDNHDDEIYDEINDEYISEDDAIQIDRGQYRGQYTHVNNTITTREGYVFYEQSDGFVYVERDSEYYLEDNVIYVERDDAYYHVDDVVYCEDESEDVLRDDAVQINGKWYHEDSDLITEINGEYKLLSDIEDENENDEYVFNPNQLVMQF